MTYNEFINNILETRGRFACGEEYHERHHIVPKCMGGTNEKENLIDLFAREHFEAHRMLALENPEHKGLVYAWWNMAHMNQANQRDYEITAEEYEEARIKFSNIHSEAIKGKYSGENSYMYGKHLSDETKEKLRQQRIGKPIPEETKKKISKATSGNNNPNYGKRGVKSPNYGRKHSDETKKKIRDAHKKENLSKETIQKLKDANKGNNNPASKKVNQYSLNGEFIRSWDYMTQIEDETGVNRVSIGYCCRGKYKQAGGFIWRYAEDATSDNVIPYYKKIIQYTTDLIKIKIWNDIITASKELNIDASSIAKCCKHTSYYKTAGNFVWHYLYDQTCKDGTVIPGAITLGLITEEEALKMLEEQKDREGEN